MYKKMFAVLLLALLMSSNSAFAAEQTVKLTVPGIT